MFLSLRDPRLIDTYNQEFTSTEFHKLIVLFLEKLRTKSYAEKLSVVTSIGQLYLTAHLSWGDKSLEDVIRIREVIDKKEKLILLSYHTNSFRKSVAERLCCLEEAVEYIDLYALRLLETKYGKL